MSYDLGLYYDKTPALVECHTEGGTYVQGGTDDAQLNITYNYGKHYYATLDTEEGLRWLYGKRGSETVERLQAAVNALGTVRYTGPYHVLSFPDGLSHPLSNAIEGKDLESPENADLLRRALAAGVVYNTGGYWKDKPGNAGYALSILLSWAKQHPDAVWQGD